MIQNTRSDASLIPQARCASYLNTTEMINLPLTIIIPTYNRLSQLKSIVSKLLILGKNFSFEFIILDNHSEDDLTLYFKEIIPDNLEFSYIRRKFNCGANSNILKCFELCNKKWLIVLGDDDSVKDEFFEILSNYLNNDFYNQYAAIKFRTNLNPLQLDSEINNIDDFLMHSRTTESWGAMAFVSSWLFQLGFLNEYIKFGYIYSGLNIPHVVPILFGLRDRQLKIKLVSDESVKWNAPEENKNWDIGLVYSLIVNSALICPIFSDHNKLKLFMNGVVGSSFKQILKFLLCAKFSLNSVNFKYIKMFIYSFSIKYKIAAIVFTIIQPLLDSDLAQRKLTLMFGRRGFERS